MFLGIALVLSVLGCGILWMRSRQPGSMEAHIRDFERELEALAPGNPPDRPRPRTTPPRDDEPDNRSPRG
jgi:hypothetical protein